MPWYDKKSKEWRFVYKDDNGSRKTGSSPSKDLAKRAAASWRERSFQIKHNLLKPELAKQRDNAAHDLSTHVVDYATHLRNLKKSEQHVLTIETRLPKLFAVGKLHRLPDITPTSLAKALKLYGEGGVSEQTVKHAFVQVKAFLNWCAEDTRIAANPIGHIKPPKVTKIVHPRRPATPDELRQIILAARRKRAGSRKWTPEDREALIVVLCGTGLRKNECRSLTPECFCLAGDKPSVVVKAEHTKNKDEAEQPVASHVVPFLSSWLQTKRPGQRVFPAITKNTRVSEIVYRCCKVAGIPAKTAKGFLDGHALRHTYGTLLAEQDQNPKRLMKAMRHKSIATTMRYLHADDEKIRGAVEKMPHFLPAPKEG